MTRSAGKSSHRRGIYVLGSITALILLAYCLATMVMVLAVGGQPQTVQGIFDVLRQNRLVGLLRLDMLTTLLMPLYYLLFASLYAALREPHEHSARIAALLGCIGVTLFLAAPSFFSCLVPPAGAGLLPPGDWGERKPGLGGPKCALSPLT